jgi:NTP pyrophosphatase (non-canonical NTP hydrolase)
LALIEQMLHNELPYQITQAKSMQVAFDLLRSYPTIGDFLAYQYVTDINYSSVTDFSEMEFVVPGPGSLNGIRKCFYDTAGLSDTEVIRFMADRQDIEFQRLGIDFKTLWGRPLQLIDCQNLFCETDKYARVSHPEFSGATKRTRIKQLFRPHPEPISYWYPPKWGINSNLLSPPDSVESTNATSVHSGVPDMELNKYQARATLTDRHPANDNDGIMIPLLGLAGEAGELLTEYKKRLLDGDAHTQFRDRFSEELGDILWYVANLATKLQIPLGEVADRNLLKCEQRWKRPLSSRRAFDEGFPTSERFPRRFLIDFATTHDQQEQPLVRLYFQDKPFGDVLTDNAYAHDGYGYHDALHLAFAAVLGWSPEQQESR